MGERTQRYFERHPAQGWLLAAPVGVVVIAGGLASTAALLIFFGWIAHHTPVLAKVIARDLGIGLVCLMLLGFVFGAGYWALTKAGIVADHGDFG